MANSPTLTISDLVITPADPNSPIPLYFQIENDLRRLITSGQIAPGSILPPELELGQAYQVGRHTMRSALARLAADGLVTRRAGRGTIVQPQTDRKKFYLDRSFTHLMADMGRTAHSEVLDITPATVEADAPEVFQSKIGAGCLRLVRLRFGDDEPIGIQCTTILTDLCPGLEQYDFNQNGLYDTLASAYHLVISQIHHTIGATTADQFQADLLDIAEGDPVLVVKTAAYLDDHQVIEHTISYYRADKYEYSTTHSYTA